MRTKYLNTKGFGLAGVLIVIVILTAVAGGGAYVYHKDHEAKAPVSTNTTTNKTSKTSTAGTPTKTATTPDPYAGWKTASLKYEQVTFKYPGSWQISNTSKDESQTGGVANPGADSVTVTSPTGQVISIGTGLPYTFENGTATVLPGAQSVTSLGGTYYLDFYNRTNSSTDAIAACLDKTPTPASNESPYITSKNITLAPSSPAADLICIGYVDAQGNTIAKPVSTFEQDASYDETKLIIESLTY